MQNFAHKTLLHKFNVKFWRLSTSNIGNCTVIRNSFIKHHNIIAAEITALHAKSRTITFFETIRRFRSR